MKVLGVVGLPASGKGEFAKIAAAQGIPVIVMGDVIRRAVEKAGMAPTDENMGIMATKLRKDFGMDTIARLCIPEISRQRAPIVLVDGIRGDSEVRLFKKHFPGFVLVAVETSFEKRLGRLGNRGRSDDAITATTLHARDVREIGWGLDAAIALADYHLNNDKDLPLFTRRVRELLKRLESGI